MKLVMPLIRFANAEMSACVRVLSEVVRRGSFSAAAEALSYTQSAVSQAIARLEAETGATLIVRDRAGVRPTAAGASLVEHAEGIFARIEAAETELAAVLGVRAGAAPNGVVPVGWGHAHAARDRHFPGGAAHHVALTLAEGEPEEIAPRLRAGEFDFALLFGFPGNARALTAPGCGNASCCSRIRCWWRFRPSIPLAGKPALSLDDWGDQDGVETSATSRCARHVVRSCVAAGLELKVTFESDDDETVQGLVAAGVGVALIPRLALTHVHPGIVVRALAPRSPALASRRRQDRRGRRGPGRPHDDQDPRRRRQALHRAPRRSRLRGRRSAGLRLRRQAGRQLAGVRQSDREREPARLMAGDRRGQSGGLAARRGDETVTRSCEAAVRIVMTSAACWRLIVNFRCLPLAPVTVTVARGLREVQAPRERDADRLESGLVVTSRDRERHPRPSRADAGQRHVRDGGGALDGPVERCLRRAADAVGDDDRHGRLSDPPRCAGYLAGRAVDRQPARQSRGLVRDGRLRAYRRR